MEEKNATPEEELRHTIRAEIEQREHQRKESFKQRMVHQAAQVEAERRRQIYQEELRKFYSNRPGYREVIAEDGEVDWVPEEETSQNGVLFDEVLEDPSVARKRMKIVVSFAAFLIVAVVASLFIFLYEGTGTIQVLSNVEGARVILDGVPLSHSTDALIEEIPAGEHVITVEKAGYRIVGDLVRKIELKGGQKEVVSFTLVPEASAEPDKGTTGGAAQKG